MAAFARCVESPSVMPFAAPGAGVVSRMTLSQDRARRDKCRTGEAQATREKGRGVACGTRLARCVVAGKDGEQGGTGCGRAD